VSGGRSQRGLSLLEVLIAWVVLSIGLLGVGLALMQTSRAASASRLRTQAVIAAESLANRMLANRPAALAGDYQLDVAGVPPAAAPCSSRCCDASEMAAADIHEWYEAARAALPGLQARVSCGSGSGCSAIQRIELRWEEPAAGESASSCGAGSPLAVQCYELLLSL